MGSRTRRKSFATNMKIANMDEHGRYTPAGDEAAHYIGGKSSDLGS